MKPTPTTGSNLLESQLRLIATQALPQSWKDRRQGKVDRVDTGRRKLHLTHQEQVTVCRRTTPLVVGGVKVQATTITPKSDSRSQSPTLICDDNATACLRPLSSK